jgi:hypothetical protein
LRSNARRNTADHRSILFPRAQSNTDTLDFIETFDSDDADEEDEVFDLVL